MTQLYNCRATIKHKWICIEKYILIHKIRIQGGALHPNSISHPKPKTKAKRKDNKNSNGYKLLGQSRTQQAEK